MSELVPWLTLVDQMLTTLQGGGRLPRDLDPKAPAGAGRLLASLRRRVRQGRSITGALAAVRSQLRQAREYERERRRLEQMAVFRLALAGCFGLAARVWLAGGRLLPLDGTDAAAVTMALGLGVTFSWLVRRWLPRGWLWDGELTAVGWLWTEATLGDASGPGELAMHFERLRLEELRTGVSRADARRDLLEQFAARQREADRQRLGRVEAAWPLAELAGIGLPLALMVAVPAVKVLGL